MLLGLAERGLSARAPADKATNTGTERTSARMDDDLLQGNRVKVAEAGFALLLPGVDYRSRGRSLDDLPALSRSTRRTTKLHEECHRVTGSGAAGRLSGGARGSSSADRPGFYSSGGTSAVGCHAWAIMY